MPDLRPPFGTARADSDSSERELSWPQNLERCTAGSLSILGVLHGGDSCRARPRWQRDLAELAEKRCDRGIVATKRSATNEHA